jgi:hypothetical protein
MRDGVLAWTPTVLLECLQANCGILRQLRRAVFFRFRLLIRSLQPRCGLAVDSASNGNGTKGLAGGGDEVDSLTAICDPIV